MKNIDNIKEKHEKEVEENLKYRDKVIKFEFFSSHKNDRDVLGKRFGKKNMVKIMTEAISTYNRRDYYNIVGWVVNQTKRLKKLNYTKKENFNKIKNIFDGFLVFIKDKQKYIKDVLKEEGKLKQQQIVVTKTTNNNISKIFQQKKDNRKYNYMVREKEKAQLDITDSGDVVAPGDRREDD